MTSTQSRTVDYTALALGKRLGRGGQGSVYEVTNRKFKVGTGPSWNVVFKEYDTGLLPSLDAAALTAMVDLLFDLSTTDGAWLCERAAWPAAVVERQGQVCGFLMRAVPDRFRFTLRSLSGSGTSTLANFEYLLNDDAYIAGIGLTIGDSDRVALLADLSATLAWLHRNGIVVGDLSPKNLLFSTRPEAACFLLDCDAMRLRGASVLPQAETPDWQLPSGEEKATRPGDIYKLGLLAARLFERDQSTTDPTALTAVTPMLGNLATTSLSPEPSRRPSPGMWTELATAATPTVRIQTPVRPSTGPPGVPGTPTMTPPPPPPILNPVLLAIAATVIIVLVVAFVSTRSQPSSDHGRSAATTVVGQNDYSATRTTQPYLTTRAPVTRVGIVDLAPALADDSRAIAVATTLNAYFGGINNHDYSAALDQLDPSLRSDKLASDDATSFDRNIEVLDVGSGPSARVTFQSTQAAGMGPRGLEWATCVNWDLRYTFTDTGSRYLIAHSTSVTGPSPC
ncbi:hypothetical protein VMT65_14160 [Nocardia sp. CDC153]|uniref:hypothetical protein n=1 Tax=Nocardia sp. CDC153 TaxID=3112167 RepID=UPI002DBA58B6|nr:hypothetical protein [Nocardia sp. CDC153]MEC3954179.1 hypothetical protein [Nocardia sp. CDC153]